jgi:hypothetical protein
MQQMERSTVLSAAARAFSKRAKRLSCKSQAAKNVQSQQLQQPQH